jgi:hypothetical protein
MIAFPTQPSFLTLSQEVYLFEQQGSQPEVRAPSESEQPDSLLPPMPPLPDPTVLLNYIPFKRDTVNPRAIDPTLTATEPQTDPGASGETSGNQTATSSSVEELSCHTQRSTKVVRKSGRVARTQHATQAVFEDRKIQNRLNSQKLRAAKKEYVTNLEKEHANLTQQNGSLKAENESLKREIEVLKMNQNSFFQDYDGKVQETFRQLREERQKLLGERQKFVEFYSTLQALRRPQS